MATYTWYIGPSHVRSVAAADWTRMGVANNGTVVWNSGNGWSVDESTMTAAQVAWLAAQTSEFLTGQAASARAQASVPTGGAVDQISLSTLLKKYDKTSDTKLTRNALHRQEPRTRRLGPVTTDITSVAAAAYDATLTKAYAIPDGGPVPADYPVYRDQGLDEALTGTSPNKIYLANAFPKGAPARTLRLMSDAPKLQWILWNFGGFSGYQVFVDGAPVTLTPVTAPASAFFLTLIFPNAATRLIEIRTEMATSAVYCSPLYRAWKPEPIKGPRVLLVGDSLLSPLAWDPATGLRTNNNWGFGCGLEDHLGIEDLWMDGISGSGFINRTAGGIGAPNNNFKDRIADHIRAAPDVVVVEGGGQNDLYNGNSEAATVAAMVDYFTTLRASLPDARLVCTEGIINAVNYSTPAPHYTAVRAAAQAALQSVGVYWIDTYTTAPWFAGAGYIPGHAAADGPNDRYIGNDGIHPTQDGHVYLRRRLAPKIHRVLADDGRLLNQLI